MRRIKQINLLSRHSSDLMLTLLHTFRATLTTLFSLLLFYNILQGIQLNNFLLLVFFFLLSKFSVFIDKFIGDSAAEIIISF